MKNKLRVLLCVATILALVTTGLWSEAKTKPVTLEWMEWGWPTEQESFKATIAAFEKQHPDIHIKITELGWNDFHRTLDLRLGSGDSPDIYRTIYPYLARYIEEGQTQDLSKYVTPDYWNRFWPALRDFCSRGQSIYGIPQMVDTSQAFYNIDLFNQAGIKAPASLKETPDWYELERMGQKLKTATKVPYAFCVDLFPMPFYIHTWGGGFTKVNSKEPDLNKPSVIEGLKLRKKWFDQQLDAKSALFSQSDDANQLFALGKTAMAVYSGPFILEWLDDQIKDQFKWASTYTPRGPAGISGAFGGCLNCVSSKSHNIAEAAEFVVFAGSDGPMKDHCLRGFIPASQTLAQSIKYPKHAQAMQVGVELYSALPDVLLAEAKLKNYAAMQSHYGEIMTRAYNGEISIEEAVKQLEEEIKKLM